MTDLTPLFNQCVEIIQDEMKSQIGPEKHPKPRQYYVHDSFNKESRELYHHGLELNLFLDQIKQPYLAINYDDPNSNGLSMDDKNKLDEDFQIKLQALYEKLKILQNYENKRESIIPKSNGWVSNLFGDDDDQVYFATLGQHRTQILRFLSDCLNNTNRKFQKLAGQRQQREKQLNLLNFQNLEEDIDLNFDYNNSFDADIDSGMTQKLDQEQIQTLESENQNFLTLKTNQLKQVEKLHNSMVDIINIQTEITYQIESQSQQITNLLDNQDQINLDLTSGNKKLTSAGGKNKRSANIIIITSIVLGLLILFMDYVN